METYSDSNEFTNTIDSNMEISESLKETRNEINAFLKENTIQREDTQNLIAKLTQQLKNEVRPPVRQIYLDSLNELETLRKHHDQLKEKWIGRLNDLKCLSHEESEDNYRGLSYLWFDINRKMGRFILDHVEGDIAYLKDGNTELQFLIMAINSKLMKLIIWIAKKTLVTLSLVLVSLSSKFGLSPDDENVHMELGSLFIKLAGYGDGKADKEAIINLKDEMKLLKGLWKYILAEKEKCVKYLPNLEVDDSNCLPREFFILMELKIEFFENSNFLAFEREQFFFVQIFLDTSHREELIQIIDMVKLTGLMVKRLVLFPILEQKEVSRKICSVCLKEDEKHLSLCRWCRGVTYCSQECVDMDSPRHKVICGPSKVYKIKRMRKIMFQAIDDINGESELTIRIRIKEIYKHFHL